MTPEQFETILNNIGLRLMTWWLWPLILLIGGVMALVPSLIIYPLPDVEQLYLAGIPFGGPCAFREQFTIPCPACGMTRSWIWAARGALPTAFTYNAAGASLFLWLVGGGVLGSLRLIRRRSDTLQVPFMWVVSSLAVWFFLLFIGLWIARSLGINPLP